MVASSIPGKSMGNYVPHRIVFEANLTHNSTLHSSLWLSHPFLMTRHCWKCGTEYAISGQPGRSESCEQCRSDLRVCKNCVSYDPKVAEQCRDRRAEQVTEKHMANFCEWFEMAKREFQGPQAESDRAAKARDEFNKLFGD